MSTTIFESDVQAPGKASRNRIDFARILPVAALVVPLTILAIVGWLEWRGVWADAKTDIERAAASAAEYGQRALEGYVSSAGWVNERLRGMTDEDIRANEEEIHTELEEINAELAQTEVAFVINRHGFPLASNIMFPVPNDTSLADRDYFQALKADGDSGPYVSKTFLGRFDGQLYFSVARIRTDSGNPPTPDGFDGVVLVSVDPNLLADGLTQLLEAPTDRMALMRSDGYGLSTTSGLLERDQPLPKVDESSPFYTYAGNGAHTAIYLSSTAMPGSRSLLAMHRIDGFPIYAVSIRPRAAIVATWWDVMIAHLAFGLPATLGLFLLSLKVAHDQRKLAVTNLALHEDNVLSSDRLDRAARFGLVGTFEFDILTGVNRRSAEYMAIHGLPAVPTEETHNHWANRLHPDDRARAEGEVLRILSDDCTETEYSQTYRIVTPSGEPRWIAARAQITRDATGRAIMMRGAHVDVTPLRTTERALAESDARLRLAQDAVGIGTWEWMPGSRTVDCSSRMLDLWQLDPQNRSPRVTKVFARINADDQRMLREKIAALQKTGGFRCEFRIKRPGSNDTLWIAARGTLVSGIGAAQPRLMGIAYDITETKRAEEMSTLMANEVEHRAKNTLQMVGALMRMTKADSTAEFVQVMDGRLKSLSATMGLLRQGKWQGTPIHDIIESALAPFVALPFTRDDSPVQLHGPKVIIDADSVQPLSMALHELSTNASKYGALSTPEGKLAITWALDGTNLAIRWKETGGPTLSGPPSRKGFGSRLIAMLFESQLNGEVSKTWEHDGVLCNISFPLVKSKLLN